MIIPKESRYRRCELLRDPENRRYLARMETRKYPCAPDDRFYMVQPGDRVDNLAYKFFGDSQYWWVICEMNDILFPLPLEPGTILRYPSMGRLLLEVLA